MAVVVSRGPRRGVGRRTVVGLEHHEHGKVSLPARGGASDHALEVPVSRCPGEVIMEGEFLEELGLHDLASRSCICSSIMSCISSSSMLSSSRRLRQILEVLSSNNLNNSMSDPSRGPSHYLAGRHSENLGEAVAIAIIILSSSFLTSKPRERMAALSSRKSIAWQP
jgi:hypothetical protein